VGGVATGQPPFEVALAAGRQGQVLGGEPVEQDDGGPRVLVHDGVLLNRGGDAVVAAAKPAQQMPDGVAVEDLTLAEVGPGGEDIVEEALQPGHVLIAWRERPGGDQHAAQVREDRGLLQVVKFGVG
jgi:hypothetical protein